MQNETQPKHPQAELHNPWEKREAIPSPSLFSVLLSLFALLLASVQAVSPFGEIGALIVTGLLFAYVVLIARTPGRVAPLLLTAAAPVLLGMSFSVSAFLLSVVAGTAAIAFLLTSQKRGWLSLLIPAGAFALSWALSGDLLSSLGALGSIPGGLLLAFATRRAESRTSAIAWTGAGMTLAVALPVFLLLLVESHAAGVELAAYVGQIKDALADQLILLRDEWITLISEEMELQSPELAEQLAQIEKTLTDSFLRDTLVPPALQLSPGFLLGGAAILAYEAQLLLTASYRTSGLEVVITRESCDFTMSVLSAILYILSLALVLFAANDTLVWAVAANAFLMLFPGFLLIGARSLLVLSLRLQGGGTIIAVLILGMFCCNFIGGLLALSFWGASGTALLPLRERLMRQSGTDGQ